MEKIFIHVVGDFEIGAAFEAVDLLFERGYNVVSCAQGIGNLWFVEVLHQQAISESEIRAVLCKYVCNRVEIREQEQVNWLQKSFENFRPFIVGDFYMFGPHMRGSLPPSNKIAIEIAASTAFGTGEHPTTGCCLLACQTFFNKKVHRRALDIGCGSGILSVALAKLGAIRVEACDNDMEAVRVARENMLINKVSQKVSVFFNQAHEFRYRKHDFIVANILADPLIVIGEAIVSCLSENGILIVSGFTSDDHSVFNRYITLGMSVKFKYERSGWTTLVFQRTKYASTVTAPVKLKIREAALLSC
ncbi:MAG: 50S ribosomal protein L11 methyltransferase [Holosporaceae bacterium]|jgi:ribosomal protein L11 methyltransferase|nr:50S ribosomal protein L11 methyltransferase [Holosporaceae bacterium]